MKGKRKETSCLLRRQSAAVFSSPLCAHKWTGDFSQIFVRPWPEERRRGERRQRRSVRARLSCIVIVVARRGGTCVAVHVEKKSSPICFRMFAHSPRLSPFLLVEGRAGPEALQRASPSKELVSSRVPRVAKPRDRSGFMRVAQPEHISRDLRPGARGWCHFDDDRQMRVSWPLLFFFADRLPCAPP